MSGTGNQTPTGVSLLKSEFVRGMVDDELDEAAIMKNHLDPVPFPEPPFTPSIPYRYLLWKQTESPIKLFKETPV